MIVLANLNGLINLWALGRHISLKVGKRIDIGRVSALDILAVVGIYFA